MSGPPRDDGVGVAADVRNGRLARRTRMLMTLFGPRVLVMTIAAVPLGILLGLIEILFGGVVYDVLVHYGLSATEDRSFVSSMFSIHPAFLLLGITAAICGLRFLVSMLPSVAFETQYHRIRVAIVEHAFGRPTVDRLLPIADVSHILMNLAPRTASFINSAAQVIVAAFLLATMVVGLVNLSPSVAVLTFISGGILLLPVVFLRKLVSRHSEALHAHLRNFTQRLLRDLRSVLFVKTSGVAQAEHAALVHASGSALKSYVRYMTILSLNGALPVAFSAVVVVIVLEANMSIGALSAAGLVPFIYLVSRVAGAAAQLASALAQVENAIPFLREMARFAPVLFPSPPLAARTGNRLITSALPLAAERLGIGYDRPLLAPLELRLDAGQVLFIGGDSGRGKTTLLMTLLGLLPSLRGRVTWNGVPVEEIAPGSLRQLVGYSGPDPLLLDTSIADNLLFGHPGPKPSEPEIRDALWCAVADFVHDLNGGIGHRLLEGGEGISAGQKQRMALARALLRRPQILVLDEATANIDEKTEAMIMMRVRARFPDMAIIAVSHRQSLKSFATTVVSLEGAEPIGSMTTAAGNIQ